MTAARVRRAALLIAVAGVGALGPAAPADAAPWGGTGADYSGGIVCHLPGDVRVPMARWSVSGTAAFATADVVARGTVYGPAPENGFAAPIAAGQDGLSSADIATLAYLIEHHGSASAAQVAETSADVATLTGRGGTQARCLGQQGTSAPQAAALLSAARRFAGPYTVTVGAPGLPVSASRIPVSATVRSAAGIGTRGLRVAFTAGTASGTATTDAEGVARTTLPAQIAPSTPLLATVSAPVTLTYIDSNPGAVAPADPSVFTGTGRLAAVRPKPAVAVTGSENLVLAHGRAVPSAQVTGTFGYSGTGSLTVSGPVAADAGHSCSALPANAFAHAPQIWTGPFTFTGDGRYRAGRTRPLSGGCYLARSTVTTTDSNPPVKAASAVDANAVITVAALNLTQANTAVVAPAGRLAAVVTAASPGRATVTSSLTAHGPLPTADGTCSGARDWAAAPVVGTSDPVALVPADTSGSSGSPGSSGSSGSPPSGTPIQVGPVASPSHAAEGDPPALAGTVRSPAVEGVGCYALVSHSVVTLDGRSVTVDGKLGAAGTTTLVAEPRLTIANNAYDGERGQPMTGTVTVTGAYRFAGHVSVGLIATTPPITGCHPVSFPDRTPVTKPTTAVTRGDGIFTFRTPKPPKNLCYSVTAVLSLDANHAVRSNSPAPSDATTFLAGVPLRSSSLIDGGALSDKGILRPAVTLGVTYGVLFGTALFVMIKAAAGRRAGQLA